MEGVPRIAEDDNKEVPRGGRASVPGQTLREIDVRQRLRVLLELILSGMQAGLSNTFLMPAKVAHTGRRKLVATSEGP